MSADAGRPGHDPVADDYATYVGPSLLPLAATLLALAGIRTGDVVGDIGCGSGLLTHPADAAAGPTGQVYGFDVNRAMLAHARARRPSTVHWVQADAARLPLPPHCLDKVICASVLNHVADAGAVLAELRRVLLHGGRVALSSWGELDADASEVVLAALTDEGVDAAACRRRAAISIGPAEVGPEQLPEVLKAHGFRIHYSSVGDLTLPFLDPLAYARWRLSFPRTATVLAGHPHAADVRAAVAAATADRLGPGPVLVAGTVHYAVGVTG